MSDPFWQSKTLSQMSEQEWDSLCDGCGKCCLHKLQDELDDGSLGPIEHTNVACRLLDIRSCRCTHYAKRWDYVPDCVQLIPQTIGKSPWLPPTCAYRLLHEGKPLPDWHPLITGDPESVHEAGMSLRGRAVSERMAGPLEHHLVDWDDL